VRIDNLSLQCLAATDFASLSKLIDKAKQIDLEHQKDKAERELRKKTNPRGQTSQGRGAESSSQTRPT